MKVKDLVDELKKHDPDMTVIVPLEFSLGGATPVRRLTVRRRKTIDITGEGELYDVEDYLWIGE